MSGGHYDYAYTRIQEFADALEPTTPLRAAFKEHMNLVVKAAHDIEWVDSCDWGPGDEDEALRVVLSAGSETCKRAMEWSTLSNDAIRLRLGEVTASEIRTIRAVLRNILFCLDPNPNRLP